MLRTPPRSLALAALLAAALVPPAQTAAAAPAGQAVTPADQLTRNVAVSEKADQLAALDLRRRQVPERARPRSEAGAALAEPCVPISRKGVVGVPALDGGAGAVNVHRESGGELLRRSGLGLGDDTAGNRFGAAVTTLDVHMNFCASLLIGAPGAAGTGEAYLVFDSPEGYGQGFASVTLPLPATAAAGDGVGTAVAVSASRNPGGNWDPYKLYVWVGAPGRDVAGKADAGAIELYSVTRSETAEPVVAHLATLTQNSPGIPGSAEAGDRFGEVIAGDVTGVVVGTPREDVGTAKDAGMITSIEMLNDTPTGRDGVTQNTAGVPGVAEASDNFGAAVSANGGWALVGVPGEDIGSAANTGMVHELALSFYEGGTFEAFAGFHQNTAGFPGANESNDRFGASVGYGAEQASENSWDYEYFIGVPGEDLGTVTDAGAVVTVQFGPSFDTLVFRSLSQGSGGLPGAREAGDRFGATLALGFGEYASSTGPLIGAPGEDVGTATDSGFVVGYEASSRSNWSVQLTGGAQAAATYGAVIAAERHIL